MAKYKPFQIVELPWRFPNEKEVKPHPAMILSPEELEENEDFFYAVLLSTKNYFPEYTIKTDSSMFTKPINKEGYFVTHFMFAFPIRAVISNNNNFLKSEFRKNIIDKIKKTIFAI